MISADCFVVMGAAAIMTRRIRLGTGVLVPSNRIAPVTANALATLNHMAPGRIDFGVGTGFTARRAMGLDAMRLADMETYIEAVYALLREETVEAEFDGVRRKIRFLNPDAGLINTRDPIALHVSAYGPRARQLTARLRASWLNFVGDMNSGLSSIRDMRQSWEAAGHAPVTMQATAFALGCVLQAGEACDSPRAMAQAGPRAAVVLHRAADEAYAGLLNSNPAQFGKSESVRRYVELARGYQPEDARYLSNHRGHLLFVRPEEREFITADMVRDTSFTATAAELLERLRALEAAGYTQFTVQILPGQEHALDDWAGLMRAHRQPARPNA